jgi:hypothetical protein
MRRICLLLTACALFALPVFAQSSPVPACGMNAAGETGFNTLEWKLGYKPLESEQRLFYGLSELGGDTSLEIRYFVQGQLHLTEVVDLSESKPPRLDLDVLKLGAGSTPGLEAPATQERMIELLALRPDLVKQLHQLAQKDSSITIEVYREGRFVEALSFTDLEQRSLALGRSAVLPLVVQSVVSGPGDRGGLRISPVAGFDAYLEDCGSCTSSTPCDTECGYDEGKGGPVTCGEYGVCAFQCECSIETYYWTDWYFVRAFFANQFACLRSFTVSLPNGAWHQVYVEEWRRDQIRRTRVCPACPSCDNCYTVEEVVGYELVYPSCWAEGAQLCSSPSTPCCSVLCTVGPFTPCDSNC